MLSAVKVVDICPFELLNPIGEIPENKPLISASVLDTSSAYSSEFPEPFTFITLFASLAPKVDNPLREILKSVS